MENDLSADLYDVVVRGGRVATASDVFVADIGIRDGKIVQLGSDLQPGRTEIDARGRVVTPGGVDAHCHLDQPSPPPVRMADDFDTGTLSAACGGTTTVIPFAAQQKGHSLVDAVQDYHRRSEGKAHVDYAFHLIVSDPTPTVLNDELPGLIKKGYTSFKVYMTYDRMKLEDYQLLEVLALARAEGSGLGIARQPCDLARLVIEVVRDSVPRALDKHIDLGYDGAEPGSPGVLIDGNPTLLKELVRNLVDNAINYTPSTPDKPGVVTARVLADTFGHVLLLQVEDSGPGVPEAERELVFRPFYRALGSEADGSGLGLPIVLEIASKHDAEVTLEDARPGQTPPGARFSVRFAARDVVAGS